MNLKEDFNLFLKELIGATEDDNLVKDRKEKRMRKKECLESNKISQEEMQKQAIESIRKKEPGKYRLVYKKDTRTIVAELRKI